MDHNYAEAIELLMNGNVDLRQIAINLAKNDPVLFIQMVRGPKGSRFGAWQTEVRDMIFRGNKMVDAIKLTRARTGMGLKEAKDVVDALRSYGASYKENLWTWMARYEEVQWQGHYSFNTQGREVLESLIHGE